jgi:NAD(P)H-quinone oxidoreductase subunit 5
MSFSGWREAFYNHRMTITAASETLSLALLPLALLLPTLPALAAAGMAAPRAGEPAESASRASVAMLVVAVVLLIGTALLPADSLAARAVLSADDLRRFIRTDLVTGVMLTLISALGVVVVRYSRAYLKGEPMLSRYWRWLLLTLASVTTIVIANHLVPIVLAWLAASVCLHQLLTFYRGRPQAIVAAHKKFIISRLADLVLFGAVGVLSVGVGDLSLDGLTRAGTVGALPLSMSVAAVLIVLGAALRCAQLPFHGWLIGVMEAPTPVSALLHAGVVNIAGLVLLRLLPWLSRAELAMTLLVVIGGATAALAALIMSTQTSAKVALAWSTAAQMGLMLLQIGLGLAELALLHLVAHSLYKAYAFLNAGGVVERFRKTSPRSIDDGPRATAWVGAALVASLGVVVSLGGLTQWAVELRDAVTAALVILGVTPALVRLRRAGAAAVGVVVLTVAAASLVHGLLDAAIAGRVAEASAASGITLRAALAAAFGLLLFAGQLALSTPASRLGAALHPWLRAGLHLDALITRLTFRLWPPTLPPEPDARVRRRHQLLEA